MCHLPKGHWSNGMVVLLCGHTQETWAIGQTAKGAGWRRAHSRTVAESLFHLPFVLLDVTGNV